MSKNTILKVEDLGLMYAVGDREVHAIQNANLYVNQGEAIGIAGESGSGKSTLARVIMGLLPEGIATITAGRLSVDGKDVTHYTSRQWQSVRGSPIAMVFQDPLSFLNPVMRIQDQILEGVRRHDPDVDPQKRIAELLDMVKLRRSVAKNYPHELSGGMRQRVMLAIALGCRPKLLIADEPTTALDVTTQEEILDLLSELRSALGMSLVLISHDLGVLRRISDRIYIMYAGHTIESGTTTEVLQTPVHPYTAGLINASGLVRGDDGYFSTIGGDVPTLEARFDICPFLSRCTVSLPVCKQKMPPPLGVVDDAQLRGRCWRLVETPVTRK